LRESFYGAYAVGGF